jgi:glutamate racemase
VPLIEEGWLDHPVTQRIAHIYLDDFFYDYETGPDVLVLGCTHYPLIKPILRSVCPWRVEIVDSAECTARVVAQQLGMASAVAADPAAHGAVACFVTDSVERFRSLAPLFLGYPVARVEHVTLGG